MSVTVLAGIVVCGLGQEDDVQRRQFVTTIPAVFAAPALIGAQRHLSMDDVTELREAAERLRVIDAQIGGDHLHPVAGQYIQRALPLLEGSAPESVRTAMHSAIGGLAASAGWYAYDAAEHAQARIYLNEALLHARMAADSQLEVHVLNCAANLALKCGRPNESLRAARVGRQLAEAGGTPRTRALMAMREARAWAQLHETHAAESALDRAWEHFADAAPDDDDPRWASFVNQAEMHSLASNCDSDLGAHVRAVEGYARSVDLAGGYARDRAIRATRLGHARLATGDVEGACLAAGEAERGIASSARTRNLLDAFTRKVSSSDAPVAREFVERWRAFRATPRLT